MSEKKNAAPAGSRGPRKGESTARFTSDNTNTVGHNSSPEALLSAALDYADTGLRVHPLVDGGKKPLTKWQHAATTDAATIRGWWGRWSDANIGVIVPAGHVVLDIDLYKPDTRKHLAKLESRLGPLPDTLTCETGGGGLHLWFTCDTGKTFRAPGKGVECRYAGSNYVVMPPSIHESGRAYVWRDEDTPAAPLPSAWVDELASTRPTSSATRTPLPNPRAVGVAAWLAQLPAGVPDEAMRVAVGQKTIEQAMRAAAHDTARDRVMHVLSLGAEGHPGAQRALGAIMTAFLREFERRRALGLARAESQEFALCEFERMVSGAADRIGGDR